MSLSSITRTPECSALFKKYATKPTLLPLKSSQIVRSRTSNPSQIGTAFDYLLRFQLERWFPRAKSSSWVAESAIENLAVQDFAFYVEGMESAIEHWGKFLKNGKTSDELIASAVFLAQSDLVSRRVVFENPFRSPSADDILELRELLKKVDRALFAPKKALLLNPTFGLGAFLIGGADCDLVRDDCLIDIKTTKDRRLTWETFNQLCGYYLLSRFDRIDQAPKSLRIRKIAVYWSRYGVLDEWLTGDIANESSWAVMENRFRKLAHITR